MTLPAETRMGQVGLIVADLERSIRYYTERIGLALISASGPDAVLGVGGQGLLHLHEQPGARPVQRGRTGLYHFAILLPTRRDLALCIRNLVDTRTPLSGMSDHGVSEALYLNDPDGHGIEIYRDRPRVEWPMRGGELEMTLDPLDVDGILGEVTSGRIRYEGAPEGTTIGHVHLHVRSTNEAEAFYCGTVGFDLMQRFGGQASFVSAGGYHHHLGLNVWAGSGAPPPPEDAARLAWYEIVLPAREDLDGVREHFAAAGVATTISDHKVLASDPSSNPIVFTVRAAVAD